ncbi:MAG: hypothetical protein H6621_09400 [Halobacteriovoraceae bacterium]|nr:hypothetical protein [Halobacteriovoraceae bacterium]MCB9095271.1 hypothetical protein [Halobacteriovoraceae bacterium]
MIKTIPLLLLCLFLSGQIFAQEKINLFKIHSSQTSFAKRLSRSGIDYQYNTKKKMYYVFAHSKNEIIEKTRTRSFRVIEFIPSEPFESLRKTREFNKYQNYPETIERMKKLSTQYSQYLKLLDLTAKYNQPMTTDGNSLYALVLNKKQRRDDTEKPKLAFIGEHHARELMTHHAVLDTAEYFAKMARRDREKKFDNVEIWFIPVINPDGLDYVFNVDRWWRKNRTKNTEGSFGVDLNRNYEFAWGKCGSYSSEPNSEIYKGENFFSEIETQTIDALNEDLKFQYLISYHSSGDEVLYPYICGELNSEEQKYYYGFRDHLAEQIGFGKRFASSSGEDFEHHYNKHGSLGFLLEIGNDFQPPFEEYKKEVYPNIIKAADVILEEMNKQPFLKLHIIENSTRRSVSHALINIDKREYLEKEVRESNSNGYYFHRLPFGQYRINVKLNGRRRGKDFDINFNEGNTEFELKI